MVLVAGASASFAASASDFTGLGYLLLGAYGIGFILIYAFAWRVLARGIGYVGGKLFVHAAVLGFFLTPIAGGDFPLPAGVMLIAGQNQPVALASIVVGILSLWIVAWFVHSKIKPTFDEISREAREHSDRQ
ncbi:hypothetical protein [Lysobacter gummosus]